LKAGQEPVSVTEKTVRRFAKDINSGSALRRTPTGKVLWRVVACISIGRSIVQNIARASKRSASDRENAGPTRRSPTHLASESYGPTLPLLPFGRAHGPHLSCRPRQNEATRRGNPPEVTPPQGRHLPTLRAAYRLKYPRRPKSMEKLRYDASHDVVVFIPVSECDPVKLILPCGPT
jgi:hypothetical protein